MITTTGARRAGALADLAGELPEWVWRDAKMRRALRVRDIGAVYELLLGWGVSGREIAGRTGQLASEVSEIRQGRRIVAYDVLARIADGLGAPRRLLGLTDPDGQTNGERVRVRVVTCCARCDWQPVLSRWSGTEVAALRQATRMTIRRFADWLGVSQPTVSRWEKWGRTRWLGPAHQELMDAALRRCDADTRQRFAVLVHHRGRRRS
jgi:transcriptional regulator with XRE-family HTH domain